MLKKSTLAIVAIAFVISAFFTTSCSLFRKSEQARIKFLMVTGNYLEPRLLCELAQDRTKQPVMIFDATAEGEGQLVYLSGNRKSTSVSVDKFTDFLEFLNPKIVIFVGAGNNLFYPGKLVEQAQSNYRVVTLGSDDWEKNCQTLADILDVNRLPREYKELLGRLRGAEQLRSAPQK